MTLAVSARRAGPPGGVGNQVRDLGFIEIDDGGHLLDGRLRIDLGGSFEVFLGFLDESGKELRAQDGALDPRVERRGILGQKAADAVDEDLIVKEGIVFPGEKILELDELEIDGVPQDVVDHLVVGRELGHVRLGDKFLVEGVQGVMAFLDGAFAEILELVVVLGESRHRCRRGRELPEAVQIVIDHFREFNIRRGLGGKRRVAERDDGEHRHESYEFLHGFLLIKNAEFSVGQFFIIPLIITPDEKILSQQGRGWQ